MVYNLATRFKRLLLPITLLALPAIVISCDQDDTKSYMPNITDPAKTPTMSTRGVSTLISDSGYTKYHITTDIWNIYDELEDPLWTFPTGVQLVNFDQMGRVAANLTCDSATYYSKRRLWRLDGHIVMVNALKDTFLTQQLFWDQNRAEVYSDSFIHITKAKYIIEGYGFTSNQTMTAYNVNRPTAIIPFERGQGNAMTPAPVPMPGERDPDDATLGDRPPAPEPASIRNTRRAEFFSSSPNGSSATSASQQPAVSPNRRGSVTVKH